MNNEGCLTRKTIKIKKRQILLEREKRLSMIEWLCIKRSRIVATKKTPSSMHRLTSKDKEPNYWLIDPLKSKPMQSERKRPQKQPRLRKMNVASKKLTKLR